MPTSAFSAGVPTLSVNGQHHEVREEDLTGSLLDTLRLRLGLTGTKEGCGTGDCGACTVLLGATDRLEPINSCITPAGAALGKQVVTVEGLVDPNGDLHPVQEAMIEHHGAQCGFCTPGFVVSMAGGQLASDAPWTREDAVRAISGNLCRCTGYRPIIDAGLSASTDPARATANDRLRALPTAPAIETERYLRPAEETALAEALRRVEAAPHAVAIAAGTTDKWLEYTQGYQDVDWVLDLNALTEWQAIEATSEQIDIGALVSHADLLAFFQGRAGYADVVEMLHRFGSPQVRNRGTLGGNIANASPVADWPPVLLVLEARLTLFAADGATREVDLAEFYQGYKETALRAAELIRGVHIHSLRDRERLYVRKITKRFEDDISSILCAARISLDDSGAIETIRIAFGGMAATPILVDAQPLVGLRTDDREAVEAAIAQVLGSLRPISDVRASADYRTAMAHVLVRDALGPTHGESIQGV